MSQTRKISRNNTTVAREIAGTNTPRTCTLHSTVIVEYWPETRLVRFCNGGWATATTATRMNQCCNEWGLPFSIGRRKGTMHVTKRNGERVPFVGNEIAVGF